MIPTKITEEYVPDSQILDNQSRAKALGFDIPGLSGTAADIQQPSNFQSPTFNSTDAYGSAIEDYYNSTKFNEGKVRDDILNQFQGEIDATKGAYAQLLSQVQQQGKGRLGEDIARQARGGLLGSDFGAGQTEGVRSYNLSQEEQVLAQQAAALAGIRSNALQLAQNEINSRRAARSGGTEAYLNYLAGAPERQASKLSSIGLAFFNQGIDPTTISPQELANIAKGYGVSTGDIVNSYLQTKREQQTANEAYKVASAGSAIYDPTTGEIISNVPSSASGGLTPYQQFQATQSISKDTQARTENAREMARQAQLIANSFNNIEQGGDRSLNTQAIITSFNKILDPTSVVRESEYDRTAQGQSLLNQLQGKYDNIVSGGAGVTIDTLREAANIANQYLEGARKSIDAQNQRAQDLARYFGLNEGFVTSVNYAGEQPNLTPQEQSAVERMRQDNIPDDEIEQILGKPISFNSAGNASASNRPQRNNNPLNIKASGVTQLYPGVKGVDPSPATDGGQFLVFNSPQDGFNAAVRLLKSSGYINLSVDSALRRWSNNGYGAEVAPNLRGKKIKDLSEQELQSLVQNMAKREGYYA